MVLITTVNLLLAFIISGLVIWSVGEDPWFALKTMLYGAFGYDEGIGYTLYYTTNFIFTGLAFASHSTVGFSTLVQKGRPTSADLGLAWSVFGWKSFPLS